MRMQREKKGRGNVIAVFADNDIMNVLRVRPGIVMDIKNEFILRRVEVDYVYPLQKHFMGWAATFRGREVTDAV